ncbi:hypothetical protein ACH5Y9_09675 [Methylomonas sp. BW4-1]|uniref:hypothetical protein n=1 Tax=Methylomonas sp. BW4-1 TaxID=3376685 RepID=UPI004041AECA
MITEAEIRKSERCKTIKSARADGIKPRFWLTLCNAHAIISKANPNGWINAWTASDISISHKANFANTSEAWSAVNLNALNVANLSGGDIYGGDLGVSGKSLNTSSVAQEIDGSQALRFSLTHLAHEAKINLSRLYINDDNLNGLSEAGRVQA